MHILLWKNLANLIFKKNVIPNELEKCKRFRLDNKLVFIDRFQFLSFSIDSWVKNLVDKDCNHLSQEFDSEVLDLVKQKWFYSYEHMCILKIITKHCLTETSFVFHLVGKELVTKSINLFSKFRIIWNKNDESLSRFVLKMRCFIVSWFIWKI